MFTYFNTRNFNNNISSVLSVSDTHTSSADINTFETFDLGATLSQPEMQNEEYEEEDEEQYKEGYEEGYEKGYEEGYEERYEEGYEERYEEGYEEWYKEWYEERYEEGYGINQSEVDKEDKKDETNNEDSIMEQELENIEPLYPIAVNMVCSCWKELDELLNNHGLENGFTVTITYSDNDKNNRLPRQQTYTCIKGQKYILRKEAHVLDDCDREHHIGDCGFWVNAYHWKTDNQVHISKISREHNHALVKNIGKVKRRKIHKSDKDNDSSENLSTTSLNEALKTQESDIKYESDKDNNSSENLPTMSLNEILKIQESGSKQCRICRQRGHNA
ncbi:8163_t:CDS:2 [Gigaspora margarita]|uniref:8163_t:CDS:1 n=1 Tax=Gigaspora margarita TaxID=4874 RepID=A0ABN7UZ39_GIGMA|nr:8163_t:CDS:2 [Gigaspora margarita]